MGLVLLPPSPFRTKSETMNIFFFWMASLSTVQCTLNLCELILGLQDHNIRGVCRERQYWTPPALGRNKRPLRPGKLPLNCNVGAFYSCVVSVQGIGQSGSALSSWAFDKNPQFHARNIGQLAGCDPQATTDQLVCSLLYYCTVILYP